MSTVLLAAASVVLLAAGGTIAASEASLPAVQVAAVVAAGCVLVSLAALARVYLLFRGFRPTPVGVGPAGAVERGGGVAEEQATQERTPAEQGTPTAPVPVSTWADPDEHGSMHSNGPEHQREVFGKLAYRLQSLVNRLIHRIDQIEQEVEDPELLKSLYGIDHLATRIRRQIENLAVLGGEAPQRRSNVPVDVNAVLRASIAEIEHYTQVTAVPIHDAKIHGHAVAEIIHLLAELLENATTFTTPGAPKVMLRAHRVAAGLAIQVQDRGIGMPIEDITRLNRLLDGSTRVDVGQLLKDGRIGLAVVEILARRHNIGAELQPNIFGGTDASIVIPHELLSEGAQELPPREALAPIGGARHAAAPATSEDATTSIAAVSASSSAAVSPSPSGAVSSPSLSRTAASDTSGLPVGPRHAAPAQGTSHGSSPIVASGPAAATSPTTPGGDGASIPHTGTDTRDRALGPGEEEGLPGTLPRRKRGESYARLRSGAEDPVVAGPGAGFAGAPAGSIFAVPQDQQATPSPYDSPPATDPSGRPALPQRRSGGHMREELREPTELMRPIPGHDPTLLAALLEGRARGRDEPEQTPESAPGRQQPHHVHDWNR